MLIVVWVVIYLVTIGAAIYFPAKRQKDSRSALINALSLVMNVFIPDLARMYVIGKAPLQNPNVVDVTITIHVVLTLLACMALVIWGAVHVIAGLIDGKRRSPLRAVLMYVAPLVAFATIVAASYNAPWFVTRTAYETPLLVAWIWPATVAAPITYFRVGLAVGTVAGMWAVSDSAET